MSLEKPEYCPSCGSKEIEKVITTWCNPVYVGYICSMCIQEVSSAIFPDAYIVYEEIPNFSDNVFRKEIADCIKNTNELKIGDIVQLNSGGPKMTVKSVFDNLFCAKCVGCYWFVDGKLMNNDFDIKIIKKVKGE